jgi:hypothetical protein
MKVIPTAFELTVEDIEESVSYWLEDFDNGKFAGKRFDVKLVAEKPLTATSGMRADREIISNAIITATAIQK